MTFNVLSGVQRISLSNVDIAGTITGGSLQSPDERVIINNYGTVIGPL